MSIELPEPLDSLLSELSELHGMREVHRQYDRAHFGNCLIDVAGGPLTVRVVRDRGQWFVDVADRARPSRWYYVDVLRRLLGGKRAETLVSIEDQVEFLRQHLPSLLEAFNPKNAAKTHARLAEILKP